MFWVDEDGLPCKCRYDYLKPRTIVNLKKFANARQRPVNLAIHLAIAEYRYDLQALHYLNGYPHLYAAAQEGRVFGKCPLPSGWEQQIVEPEAITYTWVFHQMDGAARHRGPPDRPAVACAQSRRARDRLRQGHLSAVARPVRHQHVAERRADRRACRH